MNETRYDKGHAVRSVAHQERIGRLIGSSLVNIIEIYERLRGRIKGVVPIPYNRYLTEARDEIFIEKDSLIGRGIVYKGRRYIIRIQETS